MSKTLHLSAAPDTGGTHGVQNHTVNPISPRLGPFKSCEGRPNGFGSSREKTLIDTWSCSIEPYDWRDEKVAGKTAAAVATTTEMVARTKRLGWGGSCSMFPFLVPEQNFVHRLTIVNDRILDGER